MRALLLVLVLAAAACNGCEMWSTYAREHHCVEDHRVERTCWMTNVVGFQDIGGVEWPITIQQPYACDDVTYRCDNGWVTR